MRHAARFLALAVALGSFTACGTPPEPRLATAPTPSVTPPPREPPPRDSDRDGIVDPVDACPTLPGVMSAVIVLNGCPPPGYYEDGLGSHDRDGDGVLDDQDACPEDPGLLEARGCRTPPDGDGDGIPDERDACRNDAGPARDDPRLTGCPEAWVEADLIRIVEPIRFASGSADLLATSTPVLEGVAAVLTRRADITSLRVEGHTDGRGGPVGNRQLSLLRANRVARFLSEHGIAKTRLIAEGIGPDRPVDTNDTEEGRATNRRVEFHVVALSPPADLAQPAMAAPALATATTGAPMPAPPAPSSPVPDSGLPVSAPSAAPAAPAAPPSPPVAAAPTPPPPTSQAPRTGPPSASFDSAGF